MVCCTVVEPEAYVAVTVRLYVPGGVPGLQFVLHPPPPPPPPPPQAEMSSKLANATPSGTRRAPGTRLSVRTAIAPSRAMITTASVRILPPGAAGGRKRRRGETSDAAVVVTEMVVEELPDPFKLSEAGLALQVASEGAPLQVTLTVPASPPAGATLRL